MLNRLRLALASTAIAVGATTCAAPAHADPDIGTAAEAGKVTNGWANIRCTGAGAEVDCNLRFPDGVSHLDLRYVHAGELFAREKTFTYEDRTYGHRAPVAARLTSNVRVDCTATGNRARCTLTFRSRVDSFDTTIYSAGDNWGGIIASELTGPAA